jgi:2-dehydro-3-deoxyphosphooctonate aldolase (KDO 8-P synthase)
MKLAGFDVDDHSPLFLIAGPCAIESEQATLAIAERLKAAADALSLPLIFKASFDKANRSSLTSFRGIGFEAGLRVLERVRADYGLPVLTDVHEFTPLDEVAAVVDVLQTPALLCRQTDFVLSVASCGLPVNLKKGQFLSPHEMHGVVAKARAAGNDRLLVCERGTVFGYNDLVVDMRSLEILRENDCPVVFDAGHSVQRPGALGGASGGNRSFVPALARAAVAVGIQGLFLETHADPEQALSDGPNSWPLDALPALLEELMALDAVVKSRPRAGAEPVAEKRELHAVW